MVKKITGYPCDGPGCPTISPDGVGFMSVTPWGATDEDDSAQVCSPTCLTKLGREMTRAQTALLNGDLTVEEIAEDREPVHVPPTDPQDDRDEGAELVQCDEPGCDKWVKPLGLPMHKARIHRGVKWNNITGKVGQ